MRKRARSNSNGIPKFAGYFHMPDDALLHIAKFDLPKPWLDRKLNLHSSVYTIELFPFPSETDGELLSHFVLTQEVFGNPDDAIRVASDPYSEQTARLSRSMTSVIPAVQAALFLPYSRNYAAMSSPVNKSRSYTESRARFQHGDVVCADTRAGYFIAQIAQLLGQDNGVFWYELADLEGNLLGTAREDTLKPIQRNARNEYTCLPYDRVK